jgi:hypothetical protein
MGPGAGAEKIKSSLSELRFSKRRKRKTKGYRAQKINA